MSFINQYNRAFHSPDSEDDIRNWRDCQPLGQQSSYVGHLTLMGIENPNIFQETFLRVLARSQFFLFALGVQTAEELAQPLEVAFHQLREHITAAIHGVEGPELSAIVDYHVRAAVANNNLVARSFLTEELGYKITYELTLSLVRKDIKFALSLGGPGAQPQEEDRISAELLNAQDLDGHEWSENFLRCHSNIKVREVGGPQHGRLIASAFTLLRHNDRLRNTMDSRLRNYILGHFPLNWIDTELL